MENTYSLNIHNLVAVQIVSHKRSVDLFPKLNHSLDFFRVATLTGEPDIYVEIGAFTPDNHDCYVVDQKYYIKENHIYCKDHFKSINYEVEIKGIQSGKISVKINLSRVSIRYSFFSNMVIENLVLKPLISYLLLRKGCYPIHGGACSYQGKAVLFFGRGGAYKTTLIMKLMQEQPGWKFLGDDIVILDQGVVRCYPAFLSMFQYRYQYLGDEELRFIDRLFMLPFGMRKKECDINIANEADLRTLIHCKVKYTKQANLRKLDHETCKQLMLSESALDYYAYPGFSSLFPKFIEAYNYIFPANSIKNLWNADHLARLDTVTAYELEMPVGFHKSVSSKIFATIVNFT